MPVLRSFGRAAATSRHCCCRASLTTQQPERSKCYLVGVGPGSIDLCTVKAARLISSAQVLVYDDLGSQELLATVPPDCELHYVGKRGGQPSIKQQDIDKLLVSLCQQGKPVVRLKGGCCSTFSRVSSEAAALAAAGCAYELVPGVSSATAAPVLAGFPLTDTQLAGAYAVISGHDAGSLDWSAYAHIPTLVVLMGGRQLLVIAQQLQQTGWPADTPVCVVREAGLPSQASWVCTLGSVQQELGDKLHTLSPCVVVVGKVVALPVAWSMLR